MKIFKGIAIMGALLLLAAAVQPVLASCGSATILGTASSATSKSFIWTEGQFAPQYYPGYAPFAYTTPWTSNFAGQWWAVGTGDPAPGAGDDSNTWTVDRWAYYYGPGYYGSFFGGEIAGGWGQASQIDGCILNNPTGCTCILLTDQVGGGASAFALLSGQRDATGNTYYDQPGNDGAGNAGPIILAATPNATIVNTARNGSGVNLGVTVAPPTAGIYEKDGCNCAAGLSFRVRALELPTGSAPPDTRDVANWPVLDAALTPVGGIANVSALCDTAASVDLYVTSELVFDPASGGGFSGGIVSANSSRITCGANPTLADPVDVRPRTRPDKPMTPRGGSRGR
jgi:hypothetical protein